MPVNFSPLRQEVDRITEAQQLPILLIMIAFWIVCAAEWTQRLFGAAPDPRFWSVIALLFTAYGGLQIFRLNRARLASDKRDPRATGFHALQRLCASGWGRAHDVTSCGPIDNVLVSSSGVYAVQVKHRAGSGSIERTEKDEVIFGGRLKDGRFLKAARNAVLPLQKKLALRFEKMPSVKSVVVLVGDWSIKASPNGLPVDLITVADVAGYFEKQNGTLTSEEVGEISLYLNSLAA